MSKYFYRPSKIAESKSVGAWSLNPFFIRSLCRT